MPTDCPTRRIFVLNAQADLPASQCAWLEAKGYDVQACQGAEIQNLALRFDPADVIIFNLGRHDPRDYTALNSLMGQGRRPGIILTTEEGSVFSRGDIFPGNRVELLFHPIEPPALLAAISRLGAIF